MGNAQIERIRNVLLLAVLFLQVGLLTWEYFNGGIATHHLLMREDLPGFSNLWGIAILPLLVWLTGESAKKRLSLLLETSELSKEKQKIAVTFGTIFFLSLLQSIVFYMGFHDLAKYILFGFILVGLFIPLYRMEAITGYVIGACITSGPVMPFVGVVLFGLVSVISHFMFKPLFNKVLNYKKAVT